MSTTELALLALLGITWGVLLPATLKIHSLTAHALELQEFVKGLNLNMESLLDALAASDPQDGPPLDWDAFRRARAINARQLYPLPTPPKK